MTAVQFAILAAFVLPAGGAGAPPRPGASDVEKALADFAYPSWKVAGSHSAGQGGKTVKCLTATTADELPKVTGHYCGRLGERAKEILRASGLDGDRAGTTGGWSDDRVFVIAKSAPSASEPADTCTLTIQAQGPCTTIVLFRPKGAAETRITVTQATLAGGK